MRGLKSFLKYFNTTLDTFLGNKNEERDTVAKTIKCIRELNKAGTYGEHSDIAKLLCRRIAEAYSCKEGLEFELITRLPFLEDPVEKQSVIADFDNELAKCKAFLAECLDEAYKLM